MANAHKADMELLTTNDSGITRQLRRVLVIHTFEGLDLDAASMAYYQQKREAQGSYHMVIDADGATARENDDEYIPWSAGPTGNVIGYHFSLAGRAAMTRAEWLARPKQLAKLAQILADYSRAYGIPLIFRNADGVKAGNWGVCGHNEISLAFREVDHTDPGRNFPYDVVLAQANNLLRPSPEMKGTPMTQPIKDLRKSLVSGSSWQGDEFDFILQIDRKVEELHADILPEIHRKLDAILKTAHPAGGAQ
ncbi:N-acetylmuramoyl-L-alanine amidase [Corynebacterium striatum]|uniref:peptidoglycan recognition protein family protein n=1 Tax=Corynebacterium striatum TaxID=43770 RepID=UPI003B5C1467